MSLILPFLLLAPPVLQDPPAPPPGRETRREGRESAGGSRGGEKQAEEPPTPEEAVAALEAALEEDDVPLLLETLRSHGRVADKNVVRVVSKALRHADPQVRLRALEALRFNEDPKATAELFAVARNKRLQDDPEFAAETALALGQKGDRKALRYLKEGLTTDKARDPVVRARVAALGKIRHKDSVDILMDFWVKGKARQRHPYATEISMSLAVLTGQQFRRDEEWRAWWNDNKNSFKISQEEWPLPGRFQARWDAIWAPPEESARGGGRGGGDEAGEGGRRGRRGGEEGEAPPDRRRGREGSEEGRRRRDGSGEGSGPDGR